MPACLRAACAPDDLLVRHPGPVVVEPPEQHFYQPLWTLVGGGLAEVATTSWPEASVLPNGMTWIREAAVAVGPDALTRRASADGGHLGLGDVGGYSRCRADSGEREVVVVMSLSCPVELNDGRQTLPGTGTSQLPSDGMFRPA